ncbi:MAG: hypothetical protein ACFB50_16625 [Rubrobacteraceae bacterium]
MEDTTPQINDRRFFAEWMLTFLGFPLGGIMARAFVGPMEDPSSAALGGAVAGLVVGIGQLIILRRHVGMTGGWLISTITGLALGNTLGVLLTGGDKQIGDLLTVGVTAGLAVGIAQWALLREYLQQSVLWPFAVTLAWTLGWLVTLAIGTNIQLGYTVFESFGGLVFTAITGAALAYMARTSNALARHKSDEPSET